MLVTDGIQPETLENLDKVYYLLINKKFTEEQNVVREQRICGRLETMPAFGSVRRTTALQPIMKLNLSMLYIL